MGLTSCERLGCPVGAAACETRTRRLEERMDLNVVSWVFDGIGTALVGLVVGLVTGGLGGWQLHKRQLRISQRAADHATQTVTLHWNDRSASGD